MPPHRLKAAMHLEIPVAVPIFRISTANRADVTGALAF
jgi:hypothetical protein